MIEGERVRERKEGREEGREEGRRKEGIEKERKRKGRDFPLWLSGLRTPLVSMRK